MDTTVTLKHVNHTVPSRMEYFYDSFTIARDGLITLPVEEIEHVRAAFFRGYRELPDGRRLTSFQELDSYIAEETAKSAEVSSEGDVGRRQPLDTYRIRPRKLTGSQETSV